MATGSDAGSTAQVIGVLLTTAVSVPLAVAGGFVTALFGVGRACTGAPPGAGPGCFAWAYASGALGLAALAVPLALALCGERTRDVRVLLAALLAAVPFYAFVTWFILTP